MFLGLSFSAWITIVVILAMFLVMVFTKIRSEVVFLAAVGILLLSGAIDTKTALSGFSNSSVVVIGVLFVVIAGLVHTGVLQWVTKHLLGVPQSWSAAIVRLMLPVAFLSSFLSNTTVVALFVDVVKMWCKRLNMKPSQLLIPLSYASGMGGVCTLIGTPPNMIISSLYAEQTGIQMNIFTPLIPGLVCLAVGVLSVLAMRRLLPDRQPPEEGFQNSGEYTIEMLVPTDNPSVGKTVSEAGLLNTQAGQLVEIVRFDGDIISPVGEDEYIMGGDRLVFTGMIDDLLELRYTHGLVNADEHVWSASDMNRNRHLRTAYIPFRSRLIGKTWSHAPSSLHEQMVLVAISRNGERLNQKPSEVTLQAGDTLLFESSKTTDFLQRIDRGELTFFESEQTTELNRSTVISSLIMIAMVVLSATGLMPLLQSAVLAALAMLVCRCCSPDQAMKSINWNVLMVFACSVVLGKAVENTGIAQLLADGVINLCGPHPYLVMAALCLVATFITELVSNTAAGAVFFPIAFNAATALGCNPMPFMVSLMVAVSSSFATPIGSPTHMLVYGPGGYRFTDFMKVGLPMNFIILATNLIITNLIWHI